MKVLKKIQCVQEEIKKLDLKKAGRNTFSKYDYYTPEQVQNLTFEACKKEKLFNKFDLLRKDGGLMAQMTVCDLESGETEVFEMATDIPEIKATNIAQQLGGTVTYSKRYLLMTIYDIVDNNLDFDTPQKQEQKQLPELLPSNKENWEKVKQAILDGYTMKQVKTKWIISEENEQNILSETIQ